jgi:hypothetical protein
MPSAMNPIIDMCQTQLEASRRLADVVFAGTERIDRVVMDAAHRAVTEQLNFAQAVVATRDPGGIADLQSTFMSRRPDSAMNYQRELIRVFAEIQSEVGKSMQYYIEQVGSSLTLSAATSTRAAQEHASDATFNPMTGMFSVWEKAFREASTMATRNMEAARASLENVSSAAAETTQHAVDVGIKTGETVASAAADAADTAGATFSATADETAEAAARAGDAATAAMHAAAEERKAQQAGGKRR